MRQNKLMPLLARHQYSLFVAVLAAMLSVGVVLVSGALAATFSVNNTADAVDATPGNGVCPKAGGQCTLRAAIQEANALAGADTIDPPIGPYALPPGYELTMNSELILTGAVNPFLGPLQDNGGPTFTHALLPGSLAIDASDDSADPAMDQKAVTWSQSAANDIGAFEAVPPPGGTILWTRQFGSSQDDTAEDVELDPEGNVYVLGWTYYGALPGQTNFGIVDAFVRKYNRDGNELWTRQFGTPEYDYAWDMAADRSGSLYVVGYTGGALPGQTRLGRQDAFVRKYDSNGNEVWTRQFGIQGYDYETSAYGIAVDSIGNLYVVGTTNGTFPGQTNLGAFVRKYDSNGEELWTRQFGTQPSDGATAVEVDHAANLYVVGSIGGILTLLKYDSNGDLIWTHPFDTVSGVKARLIEVDNAGNLYVVGSIEGAFPDHTHLGEDDAFVRKYDKDGNKAWTHQFGTTLDDSADDVESDPAGNVYVAGGLGRAGAFIRKYDSGGKELWTSPFGGNVATGVASDSTGSLYVVGGTSGTFPGQTNLGGYDAFVVKMSGGPPPQPPKTIIVTKTEDTNDEVCNVDCSIREAIAEANSGDTIMIPAGTYTLTFGSELTISKNLTLAGAGSGDTIIQAATSEGLATHRVFNIIGVTVAISGMTIRYGKAASYGGGIYNLLGTLSLTNSTVSSNSGSGGIYNDGTLTLTNSVVSGNNGGGIVNLSTLTLINSTVKGNRAAYGAGIHSMVGTLTLTNSTVSDNTSGYKGGGIFCSTITLTNSAVSGNTSTYDSGGGIYCGAIIITNSTVSNNTATDGGGISVGTLTMTSSTINGNYAGGNGGGIVSYSGTLTLTNSTVSGNRSLYTGGGIYNGGGMLTLINSTVSGNHVGGNGGGIYTGGVARLVNTIIAGNTASTGPDCSGGTPSLGYNLIGDNSGCSFTRTIGDLVNVDPKLGPLKDNGGPTFTHALLPGSPAIDAASPDCPPPATDQRSVSRPQGTGCDIGAYEFVPLLPDIKANGSDEQINIISRDALEITISLEPGDREGEKADWWLAIDTPFGLYWYNGTAWTPSVSVAYQGHLVEIDPFFEILNITGLPVGTYTIYFGVDLSVDGVLNEPLYYDNVVIYMR